MFYVSDENKQDVFAKRRNAMLTPVAELSGVKVTKRSMLRLFESVHRKKYAYQIWTLYRI